MAEPQQAPGEGRDGVSFERFCDAVDAAGCPVRTRGGSHADAQCPAHEDRVASLSVDWRDGAVYLNCHAGCPTADVLAAAGLTYPDDLYDAPRRRGDGVGPRKGQRQHTWTATTEAKTPKASSKKPAQGTTDDPRSWPVVARYPYVNADGEVVGERHRKEPKTGPADGGRTKSFAWRRANERGRLVWGKPSPLPLYRLPDVLAAVREGHTVWLTEGEKDADAVAAAGATATTIGAVDEPWCGHHTDALTGACVVIIADRDAAGYRRAGELCATLEPAAARVAVVEARAGKDPADHLAAGYTLDQLAPVDPAALTADPEGHQSAEPQHAGSEEPRPRGESPDNVYDFPHRGEAAPPYEVNVTVGEFRWSDGAGEWRRGLYHMPKDGWWRFRGELPYVHVRVLFWTGRSYETHYLMSRSPQARRVLVSWKDVESGRWARQLGMKRSSDRNIVTALATTIDDLAYADGVPEREAAPRSDARTEGGHVEVAVPECLPAGYYDTAPGAGDEEITAAWHRIAEIAARAPSLALALGASAASGFIGPLEHQPHWWSLYGKPQQGKTSALTALASVWGDPHASTGIVAGWDATSRGPGRLLGQLGILPAFFDESGTAEFSPSQWGQLIFSTTGGASRLQAEKDGPGSRSTPPWFGALFTTGNGRLTDRLRGGKFAGIPARVIELPAPLTPTAADATALRQAAKRGCGWLGPAILREVTVDAMASLMGRAAEVVGTPPDDGGVAGTIAAHLHLAVAGAMTADRMLGSGSALTDAATMAAREYLEVHGQEPDTDADQMLEALVEALASRRPAWPTRQAYEELGATPAGGPDWDMATELARHGYDRESSGVVDDPWLYVFPATWRRIADELGIDETVACRELHERGALHVPRKRRRDGKWQAQPRLGNTMTSVYQVRLAALEPDPEPDSGSDSPDSGADDPATEGAAEGHDGESTATAGGWRVCGEPTDSAAGDTHPMCAPASTGSSDGRAESAGVVVEEAASCLWCGRPTTYRIDGQPRHLGGYCRGAQSQSEPDRAPSIGDAETNPGESESEPEAGKNRKQVASRADTQRETFEAARAALDDGAGTEKLRVLAALEGNRHGPGPFAPRKRGADGRLRGPFWRPELPPVWELTHVVTGWQWDRPYAGRVAVLDRSGAWVAAASSVQVAHGPLEHTGEMEFADRPGYYLITAYEWHEPGLPNPLGGAEPGSQVWVPAPTVALLRELVEAGRWPDVEAADSYTGEPARLNQWASMVRDLRAYAIERYGRESDQYETVKEAFGQAMSLMLGSWSDDSATGKKWKCKAARPDWTHAIQAQAAATLWRWANDCLAVAPEHGPVALRNVDELIIPEPALDVVTTAERPGRRKPMRIDPAGAQLGSFKVKEALDWERE